MKLSIYPELCCEQCYEIIHNHFDCPACDTQQASTDIYGRSVYEHADEAKEEGCDAVITCEVCKTRFKLVDGSSDLTDDWEWERCK